MKERKLPKMTNAKRHCEFQDAESEHAESQPEEKPQVKT